MAKKTTGVGAKKSTPKKKATPRKKATPKRKAVTKKVVAKKVVKVGKVDKPKSEVVTPENKVTEVPVKKEPWTLERARGDMGKKETYTQSEIGPTFKSQQEIDDFMEQSRVETSQMTFEVDHEEIEDKNTTPLTEAELNEINDREEAALKDNNVYGKRIESIETESPANQSPDGKNDNLEEVPEVETVKSADIEVKPKKVYEVPMEEVQSPLIGQDESLKSKRTELEEAEHRRLLAEVEKDIRVNNPRGIGDVVEAALNSKTLKPLTEWAKSKIFKHGEDCGCNERRERLNEVFPMSLPNCLTERQYDQIVSLRTFEQEKQKGALSNQWVNQLQSIHADVFHHRITNFCGTCGGAAKTLKNWETDLRKLVAIYREDNGTD